MPKLLFDARYIRPNFPDGIGRYTKELAWAVADAVDHQTWELGFLICYDSQIAELPPGFEAIRIQDPTSPLELFAGIRLNRYGPDVVFSPMQTLGTWGRKFHMILTLHDLIYYRHRTPPHDLPQIIRLGWLLFHASFLPQRIVLNNADLVCTVSETSRQQILEARLTKNDVVVVPNAPTPTPVDPIRPSPGDVINLVYMGSFMGYKNVETLVKAAGILGAGYRLHLLSRIDTKREQELRALAPEADLVFHHGVSDEEYATLLADRAILMTASLDEGYGLPVAEALATGAPAVVSDLEIFHEVAGDGALYFSPLDADDAAARVRELRDPARWDAVVSAGKTHVSRYSWRASAAQLWQAVDSLV